MDFKQLMNLASQNKARAPKQVIIVINISITVWLKLKADLKARTIMRNKCHYYMAESVFAM